MSFEANPNNERGPVIPPEVLAGFAETTRSISAIYSQMVSALEPQVSRVIETSSTDVAVIESLLDRLATQMQETVDRGTCAIKTDLLVKDNGLNARQAEILHELFTVEEIAIQDLESLFPDVTRRTLQRDLKQLETLGFLRRVGQRR